MASVGHAVDALRAHAGVDWVVLLGLRLGTLIATLAAARRDDIDSLVAIAPVVTGKAHVRELRALQASATVFEPPAWKSGWIRTCWLVATPRSPCRP